MHYQIFLILLLIRSKYVNQKIKPGLVFLYDDDDERIYPVTYRQRCLRRHTRGSEEDANAREGHTGHWELGHWDTGSMQNCRMGISVNSRRLPGHSGPS